jgi:hypothetical protein
MSQQKRTDNQELLELLLAEPTPKDIKKGFSLSTERLNQIIGLGGLIIGLFGCVIGLLGCVAAWIVIPRVSEALKLDIPHKAIVTTVVYDQIFSTKGPGNAIKIVRFVTVELKHVGDQEIKPEDYLRPITFTFSKTSSITKAGIIYTNTDANVRSSEMKIVFSGNIAVLNKVLVNPGDKYNIAFCVSEQTENSGELPFAIDTRIAGMQNSGLIVYNINGAMC